MSGLPLKVRDRLEGKSLPKPRPEEAHPPRLAHYTFTYGLSPEEEEDIKSQAPSRIGIRPATGDQSQTLPFSGSKRASNVSAVISGRLKEMKESLYKGEQFQRPFQPKPYFQNWGVNQSEVVPLLDAEESEMIQKSTLSILNQTGLHEGWDSYFAGLDEMDRHEEDDLSPLNLTEREQALAAFQPPIPKPSRLKPRTYYDIRRPGTSLSIISLNKKGTSAVTSPPSSMSKKASRAQSVEPNPTLFIKPPPLNQSHGDKIIQKQLNKEAAMTPMTHEQYSNRKKELMAAALQVTFLIPFCNWMMALQNLIF